jgi:thiol:disulfide interchange protein
LLVPLLLALAPAARANAPELAAEWNHPAIAWRDMGAGVKESISSGKPVLMVMHASWCQACRRYREVFKDPRVVAASAKFVMILVDVQKYPDVNGAFAPDGTYVPRTLFVDPDGEVDATLVGSDPQYPHSLKIDTPEELLGLMLRAKSPAEGAAVEAQQR